MPKSRSRREQERNPVSREKAKKILRDDEVRGQKLTAKQKRFFGVIAGGEKIRKR